MGAAKRRVCAVMGIAAVFAALVTGTGHAIAVPCPTTTTTTEPVPTTTTTEPVPTTTTTEPVPTTTTTEPVPTTTTIEPEPPPGPSDFRQPNIVFPSDVPPVTHHVNSYKSCGSDTTDPGTVVAPPPTRTPSLGPTPSSPSAPPTYTIPTTPV